MEVIVYLETNFLMSVALGREAKGDDLLAVAPASARLAIPLSCYMEAFSAFEGEEKRRNRFREELDRQIAQLRRDSTSTNADALLSLLEESRTANDRLLNDVQARLFQFVNRAASILEPIPEAGPIIQNAVTAMLIPDPTDNLILHSILDHAGRFPQATKALLTDNASDFDTQDVQAALANVGINGFFRNVTNILGWLGSHPQ